MKSVKLSLIMLLSFLLVFPATDIRAADVDIKLNGPTGAGVGETFNIGIAINASDIKSGSIDVSIPSSLQLVNDSYKWKMSGTVLNSFDVVKMKGVFAFAKPGKLSGTVITLKFKVLSADKDATVTVTVQLRDKDNNVITRMVRLTVKASCKKHEYGSWSTKEATCTKAGSRQRVCKVCGKIDTETIAALGHDLTDYQTTVEATCTSEGTATARCKRCNQTVTKKIEKKDHTYGDWKVIREATCTQSGLEASNCVYCNHQQTREIPMTEHQYGEDYKMVVEPTISTPGLLEATCINCGAPINKETPCCQDYPEQNVYLECVKGTVPQGGQVDVEILKNEGDNKPIFQQLRELSRKITAVRIVTSLNEQPIQPQGVLSAKIKISDKLSDELAFGRLNEDGTIQPVDFKVEAEEGGKYLFAELTENGTYILADLKAKGLVPAGKMKYFVAFGAMGIILVLLVGVLVYKSRKNREYRESHK